MPVVAARAAVEASEGDATAAMFAPREEGEIWVCAKEHMGVVCVVVGSRDERKGVPRSKQRRFLEDKSLEMKLPKNSFSRHPALKETSSEWSTITHSAQRTQA